MSISAARTTPFGGASQSAYAVLPWPFRWILGFPHSCLWLGGAAGLGYLLVSLFFSRAGTFGGGPGWVLSAELAYAFWFAWLPIAVDVFVRGVERDALELAPHLGADEDGGAGLCRAAMDVAPLALWIGAGVGVCLTGPVAWWWSTVLTAGPSTHGALIFVVVRELAIEIAVFSVMGWAVGAAMRLSRLTVASARADLLDRRAFSPLARNGTRLAGLWLVVNAIGVPALLLPPEGLDADALRMALSMTVVLAGFAVVALLLPTRGVHAVLRDAKRAELSRVHSEIAEARRARQDERLPGLLAWESRIEAFDEWPIDAASLRRVGLFLLLPLASWVGAALVERFVDTLLG